MAVYQQYYRPLVDIYGPARTELADPGRHEDRPATWVPLVFHCTTEKDLSKIFESGKLKPGKKGTVSFTEIHVGELDRMKSRIHAKHQVALGFPRQCIERQGLAPVWYLKHNPEIRDALKKLKSRDPGSFARLSPFIEEDDDVSAFQEVRTTNAVSIEDAVWILTTNRKRNTHELVIPGIEGFVAKHGKISRSYWHRSHQLEVFSEAQFANTTRNVDGRVDDFQSCGEYYWRKLGRQEEELKVTLPVHKKKIFFEFTSRGRQAAFDGPWQFIDIARMIFNILREAGENTDKILQYRLIENIWEADKLET
ncbi:MAG: hypothetical protein WAN65_20790 [Candidatus Sulfotelmatobacter sp.]